MSERTAVSYVYVHTAVSVYDKLVYTRVPRRVAGAGARTPRRRGGAERNGGVRSGLCRLPAVWLQDNIKSQKSSSRYRTSFSVRTAVDTSNDGMSRPDSSPRRSRARLRTGGLSPLSRRGARQIDRCRAHARWVPGRRHRGLRVGPSARAACASRDVTACPGPGGVVSCRDASRRG